jgi:hypothetical protein
MDISARDGLANSRSNRNDHRLQVVRLALIYALLDGEDKLAEPHLQAALEVWRYCEQSVSVISAPAPATRWRTKSIGC